MAVLEERLINGVEGVVTATIKGRVVELAELTKISATAEKTTTEYKALGNRATQVKPNGWKGSGTMTLRYGTRYFRELMLDYIRTGKNTLISMVVTNNDPNFEAGDIKTRLGGVNITTATMAQLDVDTEILNEDIPFTFTEVEDL
jgi:Protein of unknown function (DUF2001).